ncbi:MAG: hypothetical protein H6737_00125 [Alphaproteobacteria bacterium]|nr:hypothetical protein [Alphaproteobacteria bacterium]
MWLGTLVLACRPAPVASGEVELQATSADGRVELAVELDDATSVLFALDADAWIAVDALEGPDGTVLRWQDWVGEEQLTSAVLASPAQSVLGWPVRAVDPELRSGGWTLTASVTDADLVPLDGVEVRAVVRTKTDDDLRRGTVRVLLLVPEALDPALRDGALAATARWEQVWGRHGLTLELDTRTAALDVVVPDLFFGDPALRDAAALRDGHDLVAWVGEELASFPNALGNAGAVPNAAFDGPRAVLGLAALKAAGQDGAFDDEEVRLFGEAMAHEAAHFLGLFHPVELDFAHTDALGDTATCSGREACEDALGGNLLFPYPICGSGDCVPAEGLTRDQRGVAHRYVGVR